MPTLISIDRWDAMTLAEKKATLDGTDAERAELDAEAKYIVHQRLIARGMIEPDLPDMDETYEARARMEADGR